MDLTKALRPPRKPFGKMQKMTKSVPLGLTNAVKRSILYLIILIEKEESV